LRIWRREQSGAEEGDMRKRKIVIFGKGVAYLSGGRRKNIIFVDGSRVTWKFKGCYLLKGKYHKKEEVIIGKTSKVPFDKVGE
jgi:hypothetical protein